MKTLLIFLISMSFAVSSWAVNPKDLPDGLYAVMKTNKGEIVLQLFYQRVPNTVANFVGLGEGSKAWQDPITKKSKKSKYYDGLTFHRVIADFMIQGGDPLGSGSGGPGFQFADEFHPQLRHDKPGVLSMANAGPNTNGSQFFITHKATPWLDDKHSVFGQVMVGIEVVNKIVKDDVIESLTFVRKGEVAQSFDAVAIAKKAMVAERALAEKNRKVLPKAIGKLDPFRSPQANQKANNEVSIELLTIAYQGSQSPKQPIYYDKEGALKIAQQLVDLARREGANFTELVKQYTDLPQQTRVPGIRNESRVPPFLKEALTLKVGQISDPVDSPFGYLIFKRIEMQLIEASHILISYAGATRSQETRTKEEAKKMAVALLKQIKAGKDFAEMAKLHSDGPSGRKGGSLGRFSQGAMVPAFEKAVFALKPGELSGVVETPFGFHLIKRDQ